MTTGNCGKAPARREVFNENIRISLIKMQKRKIFSLLSNCLFTFVVPKTRESYYYLSHQQSVVVVFTSINFIDYSQCCLLDSTSLFLSLAIVIFHIHVCFFFFARQQIFLAQISCLLHTTVIEIIDVLIVERKIIVVVVIFKWTTLT